MQDNSDATRKTGDAEQKDARSFRLDPALPVPNLFIVGAVKAGTTSLHSYLARHPEVFMSNLKEPHFFASFEMDSEFDNFTPVIRDAVAYQDLFRGSEGSKVVGEASPSYLCDIGSALRIKTSAPNARIIISLRNPVQRAHSHYLMEYRQGRETRPLAEALEADRLRVRKGWGVAFQYLEQGLYADQVKRYLDVFGAASVKIVLFEHLTLRTAEVMRELADFLEIEPSGFPEAAFATAHNSYEESRGRVARLLLRSRTLRVWSKRVVPRAARTLVRNTLLFTRGRKPVMDEGTRSSLADFYAADLMVLERLLNRDLSALRENG